MSIGKYRRASASIDEYRRVLASIGEWHECIKIQITEQPCFQYITSRIQFLPFINKIMCFPHQVISSGISNACTTLSKICHEIARHKTTLLRREVNIQLQRSKHTAQDSWELRGGGGGVVTRTSQVALYSRTQLEIS